MSIGKSFKVVFIFTSRRDKIINRIQSNQDPDTALHGLNHIQGADYLIIPSKSITGLFFIPNLLKYDFIVAQDNLLLGYIVSTLSSLFRRKTQWIYIAMNSSNLIRRHAENKIHLFILRKLWSSYAKIICLSNQQLADFRKLGIDSKKLLFVPFGIDANFFKTSDTSEEGNIILSVGRDMGRDYTTLFKVAEQLPHQFVIVASPKNIPSHIPTSSNVSILYDIGPAEIRDLYRQARLVVVVSKDENIPQGSDCSGQTAILDALAAKRTVIATHRSWISDYFLNHEDILVTESNNPEAISQVIKTFWDNSEKRKNLALSGYNKVVSRYTTSDFAKSILEIMKSLS